MVESENVIDTLIYAVVSSKNVVETLTCCSWIWKCCRNTNMLWLNLTVLSKHLYVVVVEPESVVKTLLFYCGLIWKCYQNTNMCCAFIRKCCQNTNMLWLNVKVLSKHLYIVESGSTNEILICCSRWIWKCWQNTNVLWLNLKLIETLMCVAVAFESVVETLICYCGWIWVFSKCVRPGLKDFWLSQHQSVDKESKDRQFASIILI